MKLSALFSNGMILQRGQENLLWGYANEYTRVRGSFAGREFTILSGTDGYFEITLPEVPVGGPYELYLFDGQETCIREILVGDVFLLGGQSNMELPLRRTLDLFQEELQDLNEPEIRMFEVPKEYLFGKGRKNLEHGKWICAVGEEGMDFSAVGYFLAQFLRQKEQVPIGFLQTAVGGTPVQAWCGEESLRKMNLYEDELEQCKDPDYVSRTIEKDCLLEENWHRKARGSAPSGFCGEVLVPGLFHEKPLSEFHGSLLLEKHVTVTKRQCGYSAFLVLGAIVDADRVYVNGILVGETGYKYPPRRYELPKGLLHPGKNTIRMEMFVFREKGGCIPGKTYEIIFAGGNLPAIKLEGIWKYTILKELPVLQNPTFFQNKAAGMFHGMIYPVHKWKVCCFLFYQGESNTENPDGYGKVFKSMIKDWRELWKDKKLPFIYVQLAGFANAEKNWTGTNWAKLREEQRKVLEVADTAMAVAFDAGEYNDLHPQDKKTIGYRLSLAVRKLVYGEELIYSGPMYEKMEQAGESIRISFSHTGGGLRVGRKCHGAEMGEQLKGFEVCGEDGKYVPAQARIEGERVLVRSREIPGIKNIRYAWLDDPEDANLYNVSGLPASPFIAF